jgi:hypothetical protein
MAYPGTYNINYYQGDTYEFKIYPKNSIGAVFNLSDGFSVQFFIATARGAGSTQFECQATIGEDSVITCRIPPGVGRSLTAGISYVYDVEVKKPADSLIYTLLTGTVSVVADITGAV